MVRRMKTNRILALSAIPLLGLVAGLVCGPRLAFADSGNDGIGQWEGSGVTTEAGGKEVGPFTITLTRVATSAGVVRADGKIRTADGKEIVFWQEKTDRGNGRYQLASNLGAGGGCCFANGMCQSLEQRPDGHAFASTIAVDGSNRVRVLVTELKDGQAVRFYAQTLSKKP
jgi:hypothetical protein